MDELAGLIGGLVAIVVVIYVVVWLVAIIVTAAICIALVAGPPLGLGTILRCLFLKRYTLSRRKKWQCAGTAAVAFAAPFLALFIDSSPTTCLAAAWGGTVLAMSAIILLLVTAAYQQHFAQHRHSIREAGSTLIGERIRHKVASLKLWRMNRTLSRVERRHGRLLRAQESLADQMDTLIENNDPALCRIKMRHWEDHYSAMPPNLLTEELDTVASALDSTPEPHQGAMLLHSRFIEELIIRRKLAGSQAAARFHELKAARDELQSVVAGCAETMDTCKRVQNEKTATIAQLKNQRLLIQ